MHQATIKIIFRDTLIYCLSFCHLQMGAILSAHPIRGDYQVVVTMRLLKSFCSATPYPKKCFYVTPFMDSQDVNDTCKCLITNLKRHFRPRQNHTNAHNPRKLLCSKKTTT